MQFKFRNAEAVYEANMELPKRHLVTYTWGNVSGISREKGLVVIKPSGVEYDELSPDKLVVLDLDGNIVEGKLNPSSDTKTHLELYKQYPDIGASEAFIREHWLGRRTTDCVGLLKGYGWLNPDTLTIDYNTNGMPDYNADRMYASAKENGTEYGGMDTMPDIVGLGLWKQGHWGVYVGNGYAIEAMGTQYGVVRTKVEGRGWQGWCKIPYIQYDD